MLLIILVDELQYPVQSLLILCSHISTSVSIWDLKSHNVIILRQKRNAIGATAWCHSYCIFKLVLPSRCRLQRTPRLILACSTVVITHGTSVAEWFVSINRPSVIALGFLNAFEFIENSGAAPSERDPPSTIICG